MTLACYFAGCHPGDVEHYFAGWCPGHREHPDTQLRRFAHWAPRSDVVKCYLAFESHVSLRHVLRLPQGLWKLSVSGDPQGGAGAGKDSLPRCRLLLEQYSVKIALLFLGFRLFCSGFRRAHRKFFISFPEVFLCFLKVL